MQLLPAWVRCLCLLDQANSPCLRLFSFAGHRMQHGSTKQCKSNGLGQERQQLGVTPAGVPRRQLGGAAPLAVSGRARPRRSSSFATSAES